MERLALTRISWFRVQHTIDICVLFLSTANIIIDLFVVEIDQNEES